MAAATDAKASQAALECGVCFEPIITFQGKLDCCPHEFCFPCIKKWADTENTCPQCKRRFKSLTKIDMKPSTAGTGRAAKRKRPQQVKVEERTQRAPSGPPPIFQMISLLNHILSSGGPRGGAGIGGLPLGLGGLGSLLGPMMMMEAPVFEVAPRGLFDMMAAMDEAADVSARAPRGGAGAGSAASVRTSGDGTDANPIVIESTSDEDEEEEEADAPRRGSGPASSDAARATGGTTATSEPQRHRARTCPHHHHHHHHHHHSSGSSAGGGASRSGLSLSSLFSFGGVGGLSPVSISSGSRPGAGSGAAAAAAAAGGGGGGSGTAGAGGRAATGSASASTSSSSSSSPSAASSSAPASSRPTMRRIGSTMLFPMGTLGGGLSGLPLGAPRASGSAGSGSSRGSGAARAGPPDLGDGVVWGDSGTLSLGPNLSIQFAVGRLRQPLRSGAAAGAVATPSAAGGIGGGDEAGASGGDGAGGPSAGGTGGGASPRRGPSRRRRG